MSKNRKLTKVSQNPRYSKSAEEQQPLNNVVKMGNRQFKRVEMIPRNTAQEDFIEALENNRMIFGIGPAGCGKTMFAALYAIQQLKLNNIKKIVITRPAVSVDEELGALPGTLIEKLAPYVRPIIDVFEEYYSKEEIIRMMETGVLECCPLSFIRGRTFKQSIVIVDEAQSTTANQLKAALSRIGDGSKMIITGDLRQADYGRNGLSDFLEKYGDRQVEDIEIVKFSHAHIERDPLISAILDVYGDAD